MSSEQDVGLLGLPFLSHSPPLFSPSPRLPPPPGFFTCFAALLLPHTGQALTTSGRAAPSARKLRERFPSRGEARPLLGSGPCGGLSGRDRAAERAQPVLEAWAARASAAYDRRGPGRPQRKEPRLRRRSARTGRTPGNRATCTALLVRKSDGSHP